MLPALQPAIQPPVIISGVVPAFQSPNLSPVTPPALPAKPLQAKASPQWLMPAVGVVASVATAALLHKLPSRQITQFQSIPTDWKIWTRVALGLVATQQLNEAIQWQPPPWLKALETMAITVPVAIGLKKLKLVPLLVSAPLVAGFVEGTNQTLKSTKPLFPDEWPNWAKRLSVLVPLTVLGLWGVPKASKAILKLLPKSLHSAQTNAATSGVLVTCARGCTPGGVICLSELSEMLGGASAMGHHVISKDNHNNANASHS